MPTQRIQLYCKTSHRFEVSKAYYFLKLQGNHLLRHKKPFICNVEDCTWIRGVSTLNDLYRHKLRKHGIMARRYWICAAPHCKKNANTLDAWITIGNMPSAHMWYRCSRPYEQVSLAATFVPIEIDTNNNVEQVLGACTSRSWEKIRYTPI